MIKLHRVTFILGAISFACFIQTTAFAANETIGVNSAVKGDVTIKSGEQAAKQAVVKKPVLLGDVVKSNQVGSLQVLLKDQTMFTVGPDCDLTIDKFVYDPAKNSNSMSANVKQGMFRFMSGNISKSGPNSVSIETPIASMGIRGTMVEGLIGPDAIIIARNAGVITASTNVDTQNASLFILKGPGKKNSAKNKRGKISVTSAGQTVIVKKSGMAVFVADKMSPPSKPFELTIADAATFHDKLRTKPTGGKSYKPFTLNAALSPVATPATQSNNVGFFNPVTDLQWPTNINDNEEGFGPAGLPNICTPLNPNFPNCISS